jgi:hypothetical protein
VLTRQMSTDGQSCRPASTFNTAGLSVHRMRREVDTSGGEEQAPITGSGFAGLGDREASA